MNSPASSRFGARRYRAWNEHVKARYGGRVQKVSVLGDFTCPNRDGLLGKGGCTFCNNASFTPGYLDLRQSITQQLNVGLDFLRRRYPGTPHYLAYFQSYSISTSIGSVVASPCRASALSATSRLSSYRSENGITATLTASLSGCAPAMKKAKKSIAIFNIAFSAYLIRARALFTIYFQKIARLVWLAFRSFILGFQTCPSIWPLRSGVSVRVALVA